MFLKRTSSASFHVVLSWTRGLEMDCTEKKSIWRTSQACSLVVHESSRTTTTIMSLPFLNRSTPLIILQVTFSLFAVLLYVARPMTQKTMVFRNHGFQSSVHPIESA
jgi:hypothetical protein